ncbi:MAG: radical SAM protein [Dehalococcoidia bacterium]|nr:Oxygen-independent coproporphyrinogen-III oxidase-like protein YqeR [Chloroflexota bacterium]MBT9163000.1 Oxygen-independent coproporphyrinogen-III oxidase-like protein YqeR [Chloroflexota bacterium]
MGYKDIGINRVSIGAQTFSNELLRFLGRRHSAAEIFKAYKNSRKAGFENVNIDLLMGFPGQTMETWLKSLTETLALDPEHITTTNWYTKYKGSERFLERAKNGGKKIADRTFRIKLFRFASNLLEKHGYRRYIYFNFALPGKEYCYETDFFSAIDNVISFGPGPYSNLNGKIVVSRANIKAYLENPTQIKVELPIRVRDFIKHNLYRPQGVSRRRFEREFQLTLEEGIQEHPYAQNLVNQLMEQSLIVLDEKGLRFKPGSDIEGLISMVEFQDSWNG